METMKIVLEMIETKTQMKDYGDGCGGGDEVTKMEMMMELNMMEMVMELDMKKTKTKEVLEMIEQEM